MQFQLSPRSLSNIVPTTLRTRALSNMQLAGRDIDASCCSFDLQMAFLPVNL
jgi:hypothetical protein